MMRQETIGDVETRKVKRRAWCISAAFNATRAAVVVTAADPMSSWEASQIAMHLVRADATMQLVEEIRDARDARDARARES